MPSNTPFDTPLAQTLPEFSPEQTAFLERNQEILEQLATFADFAPERLTLGFVSVNFTKDRETIIAALRRHPRCQDIQFAVLHFPDPQLRFLRDAILEALPTVEPQPDKKLVLVLTGLEYSIGMIGDYPSVLQDLNYVRDAFTTSVPHPILVCLPDWSLTRLARSAPDFWAWRLAVFRFQTLPATVDYALQQTLQSEQIRGSLDLPERQAQVDLLLRLLMESDAAKSLDSYDCKTRLNILNELGILHRHQGEVQRAKDVLTQAINLAPAADDPALTESKASALNSLALLVAQQGEIDDALQFHQQSLQLYEQIGDVQGKATALNNMALVIANQGDIEQALQLWQQDLELSERIGNVQGKATTLNNMAGVIADQGNIEQAMQLWQQSLQLYEQIGDVQGKAATLNNMAGVIANQGEIEQALQLYQQSLELSERTGNVQGKATTLNNRARVIANQGNIEQALQLYQQSLQLSERIGDVQGKATTLANMAYTAGKTGDTSRQLTFNLEAAQALGQVRAYVDLVTVLGNLGAMAEADASVYLAQAIWLCLRIQLPLVDAIVLIRHLFNAVPQGNELEALLATSVLWLCNVRGEGHPQLPQLQEDSFKLLSIAANAQGIQTQAAFEEWFVQQQLNDPDAFLPRLNQRLEAMIGNGWLFDPAAVTR